MDYSVASLSCKILEGNMKTERKIKPEPDLEKELLFVEDFNCDSFIKERNESSCKYENSEKCLKTSNFSTIPESDEPIESHRRNTLEEIKKVEGPCLLKSSTSSDPHSEPKADNHIKDELIESRVRFPFNDISLTQDELLQKNVNCCNGSSLTTLNDESLKTQDNDSARKLKFLSYEAETKAVDEVYIKVEKDGDFDGKDSDFDREHPLEGIQTEFSEVALTRLKPEKKMNHLGQRSVEVISMRAQIIEMKMFGKNVCEIAKELGLSRQTVSKWIRRWESNGSLTDGPRSGAPRKTTQQQDQEILEAIAIDPFTNASEIHRNLQLNVSDVTIRQRLREANVNKRSKRHKLNDLELRPIITEMLKSGKHVYEIAKDLCVHRHTVAKWIKRWKEEEKHQNHQRHDHSELDEKFPAEETKMSLLMDTS